MSTPLPTSVDEHRHIADTLDPSVVTQWPVNIMITKVEADTDLPVSVWQVEVYTNNGTWMEAFKTDTEVQHEITAYGSSLAGTGRIASLFTLGEFSGAVRANKWQTKTDKVLEVMRITGQP